MRDIPPRPKGRSQLKPPLKPSRWIAQCVASALMVSLVFAGAAPMAHAADSAPPATQTAPQKNVVSLRTNGKALAAEDPALAPMPVLTLLDVVPTQKRGQRYELGLMILMENTTDQVILIDGMTANVDLNGKRLVSAGGTGTITIPPQETRLLLMKAEADGANLVEHVESVLQASLTTQETIPALPWLIAGQFYVEGVDGPDLYPYQFDGQLFQESHPSP